MRPAHVSLVSVLLASVACDTDDRPDEPVAACQGAKCDAVGDSDDGEQGCPGETDMIAEARRQLAYDAPDFFALEDFRDDIAMVLSMVDLDGDGRQEVLVLPGIHYAGSNVEHTVYMTQGGACPMHYAGHFAATDVSPPDDGGEWLGVRDIVATNLSGCSAEEERYRWDGTRYVASETQSIDLCECPSDEEMVEAAREALVAAEPDAYAREDFRDDATEVDRVGDLDGDGVEDMLVSPGIDYAGPNREITIFLSQGGECAERYVGHVGATDVTPDEDGKISNGARDLTAANISGCTAELTELVFDGERYLAGATTNEPNC